MVAITARAPATKLTWRAIRLARVQGKPREGGEEVHPEPMPRSRRRSSPGLLELGQEHEAVDEERSDEKQADDHPPSLPTSDPNVQRCAL